MTSPLFNKFVVCITHHNHTSRGASMATLTPVCSITRLSVQPKQHNHNHNHNQHQLNFIISGKQKRSSSTIRLASSAPNQNQSSSSPGLYTSQKFDLTASNVDLVLDDVRPYLISDGGNVDVVSVEDGVVSLRLQGACESCPSSTTTMKMGIERVLKEKFGDAINDIVQVYDDDRARETTVEAVNNHLEILRPAIKNYGGSVEVISVEGGECVVEYVGPESIGSGIKAAIKEKFPDILNVTFSST